MEIRNNISRNEPKTYQSREEYLSDLEEWLNEARLWHGLCSFSYKNIQRITEGFNPYNSALIRNNRINNANILFNNQFVIPPLWKRLLAEIVDFVILFFIKMLITFILLDTFNIISLENYGFEALKKNMQDPQKAMQLYSEILILEVLHRFTVCCYEVYWLKGGMCATPGKIYMGLMVLHVENITSIPGQPQNVVRVGMYSPLGLHNAIIRSFLKNFLVGILVPICYVLYIFRYNRTGYDVFSNSLVVEYNPNIRFQAVQ